MSLTVVAALLLAGCGDRERTGSERRLPSEMKLTSDAFPSGGRIPERFTCDGENLSPPLAWSPAPDGNGQLAIIMRDRDARGGRVLHWVLAEVPPASRGLGTSRLPRGADELPNSFASRGYRGPCPPRGDKPHRYVFTIYALSERPAISSATPPARAEPAIVRAASVKGSMSGIYGR